MTHTKGPETEEVSVCVYSAIGPESEAVSLSTTVSGLKLER